MSLNNKKDIVRIKTNQSLKKSNEIKKKLSNRSKKILENDIPDSIQKIINKFKSIPIEDQKLNKNQSLLLSNYASSFYNFNVRSVFGQADKDQYQSNYQKMVRHFFLKLIENKHPLLFEETEEAQQLWNKLGSGGQKMQTTNILDTSGVYIQNVIALSHHDMCCRLLGSFVLDERPSTNTNTRVSSSASLKHVDLNTLFTRFQKYCRSTKQLTSMKQVSMGRFLFRLYIDLDYFLIPDEHLFRSHFFVYESKHPAQFEKFKHIFLGSYSNKERAEQSFILFKSSLAQFLDRRIFQIKDQNVDMCDFKLLVKNKRKPAVLNEYIQYLKDINNFRCVELINDLNWVNFVNHKMRGEYGYKTFWKERDSSWS